VIVNTCSVTHVADRKSRQMIRKLYRQNPNIEVLITGCSVENESSDIPELEHSKIIKKADLLEQLKSYESPTQICSTMKHGLVGRTRKSIKVQSGCDYYCTYCIIPFLREKENVPHEIIIKEIEKSIKEGKKEFVLTGINLGTYYDGEIGLTELVNKIVGLEGEFRLRLSSIEPNLITDELLLLMTTCSKLAPHLHIPLQGATDDLLKKMGRRYTVDDYLSLMHRIESSPRKITITGDLIVGFPGETSSDHQAALDLVGSGRFLDMHLFKYSPRKGTPAFDRNDQISEDIKKLRMTDLSEMLTKTKSKVLQSYITKKLRVLVETRKDGEIEGFCGNYVKVMIMEGDKVGVNEFVEIKISSVTKCNNLVGVISTE
jgi:threonylcarbamoyladenosine tRNA methylthiotransferase MtaB